MRVPLFAVFTVAFAVSGCRTRDVFRRLDFSWNRMQVQPRYDAYEGSRFFDDGSTMRAPPPGTVQYSAGPTSRPELEGKVNGEYVTGFPVPVDGKLVERGRSAFEATCATCHGVRGDGQSPVAMYMPRRPPSLMDPAILALPPGRVYEIVRDGYGLMPPYANHLTRLDRWAVIAYVHALERSQHAVLAELPSTLRAELARRAP